ncbi:MAG: GIY-YIG nuclease family protein [Gammaproteobacteria bacterium]|nr:GIY-YIG nuclease family protein [Gammaproteobacteria bacterium]
MSNTHSPKGQTINIFIYDKDNPAGIRTCEIPNTVVQAILIPRNALNSEIAKELLTDKGSVYFLFGADDNSEKPIVYIGESETPLKRMNTHKSDDKKEFFNTAVIFMSSKENMNKAHIQFIENQCITDGIKANNFIVTNDSIKSNKSKLDIREETFALNIYEDIQILLGILGYPLFEEEKVDDNTLLYLTHKTKNITAKGVYSSKGLLVLSGSQASIESKDYAKDKKKKREELIEQGVLEQENDTLIFTQDYLFNTPSGAGGVVFGRNINSPKEWKNKAGKTWNDLYGGESKS